MAPTIKHNVQNLCQDEGEGPTLAGSCIHPSSAQALLRWGSTHCRLTGHAATIRWDLCTGFIIWAHWFPCSGKANRSHGRLESTVVHSPFLAIPSAVFQWLVILINSIHAKTLQGEESHTQHFPEAAALHLDVAFVWFRFQKVLGFIIMLLCAGCVLKSWLLWWTQPMRLLRKSQSRYKTCRKKQQLQGWELSVSAQTAQQWWYSRETAQGKAMVLLVSPWQTNLTNRSQWWRPSLNQGHLCLHPAPPSDGLAVWAMTLRMLLTGRLFGLVVVGCLLFTVFCIPTIASKNCKLL